MKPIVPLVAAVALMACEQPVCDAKPLPLTAQERRLVEDIANLSTGLTDPRQGLLVGDYYVIAPTSNDLRLSFHDADKSGGWSQYDQLVVSPTGEHKARVEIGFGDFETFRVHHFEVSQPYSVARGRKFVEQGATVEEARMRSRQQRTQLLIEALSYFRNR